MYKQAVNLIFSRPIENRVYFLLNSFLSSSMYIFINSMGPPRRGPVPSCPPLQASGIGGREVRKLQRGREWMDTSTTRIPILQGMVKSINQSNSILGKKRYDGCVLRISAVKGDGDVGRRQTLGVVGGGGIFADFSPNPWFDKVFDAKRHQAVGRGIRSLVAFSRGWDSLEIGSQVGGEAGAVVALVGGGWMCLRPYRAVGLERPTTSAELSQPREVVRNTRRAGTDDALRS
ncbi:hypothetical protein BZA77DRAFT_343490 [Pyronema omphalodes]|nr:hypothetical protein BZA77DRAFT_343490 [Pyronema omphalodes]